VVHRPGVWAVGAGHATPGAIVTARRPLRCEAWMCRSGPGEAAPIWPLSSWTSNRWCPWLSVVAELLHEAAETHHQVSGSPTGPMTTGRPGTRTGSSRSRNYRSCSAPRSFVASSPTCWSAWTRSTPSAARTSAGRTTTLASWSATSVQAAACPHAGHLRSLSCPRPTQRSSDGPAPAGWDVARAGPDNWSVW
jgi:hypothetical protein